MFQVTKTKEIKITKGDDSGPFYLEVNLGSTYEPLYYEFLNAFAIYDSPKLLLVTLNKKTFKTKATEEKIYCFEYNYKYDEKGHHIGDLAWYLDGNIVLLSDWGISYQGTPERSDRISVTFFIKHISEIYLTVFNIHSSSDYYLLQKIFRNDGRVITNTDCGLGYSTINVYDTIIKHNSILLRLLPDDTIDMKPGEYRYLLKAKIYDRFKKEYIVNTLTHPQAFYVMN